MRTIVASTLLAALAAAAVPALAVDLPTVIYSDIVGSPTADVPDVAGATFTSFDRPYRSPDTMRWVITAETSAGEILILATGTVGNTVEQEGTAAGWTADENVVGFDRNLSVTNDGQYAFNCDTDGDTSADEYLVYWDDGAYVVVAQQGQPLPAPFADEMYGTTLDSPSITSAGVAFRSPSTTGTLGSGFDDFVFLGTTVVAQGGVTAPAGQAGGASETWGLFDTQDCYVSADGLHSMIQGDLTGATSGDDVLVVDGQVVIQEDSAFGALTSPVSSIVESVMETGGNWMARGNNDDTQDWVIYSGTIVAATDDPIPGGLADETIDDTIYSSAFFTMAANNNGDYVWGATTSNPDPEFDAVIALNNERVLARQGDPVDVDGNGIADDDAFIDVFNNDDSFLTDDGWYYFTADLRDSLGTGIGQAVMRLSIGACFGDLDGDNDVDLSDLAQLLANYGTTNGAAYEDGDLDEDGDVDLSDLAALLAVYGTTCP
jgi:hypothetical protein